MGKIADAWTSAYILVACWAPVFWFENSSRTRAGWELDDMLGGLLTGHQIASGALVAHSWLIMFRLGHALAPR